MQTILDSCKADPGLASCEKYFLKFMSLFTNDSKLTKIFLKICPVLFHVKNLKDVENHVRLERNKTHHCGKFEVRQNCAFITIKNINSNHNELQDID